MIHFSYFKSAILTTLLLLAIHTATAKHINNPYEELGLAPGASK